jgi:pimeloyl-ACP methyl ester carboxylesterase
MASLIFVGCTGHGGWCFYDISEALREQGHTVYAPNLSGLDPDLNEVKVINLDTHIQDVIDVIESNNIQQVVLVGHSYGGMVITGVADRTSAEVVGLIYFDAALPQPGQRLWDLIDEDLQKNFLNSAADGLNVYPDPNFLAIRPKVRPHPLATKLQPLHYSENVFDVANKVYVYAEKYFGVPGMVSPFEVIYDRLKDDQGWTTYSLPYGHDLMAEAPQEMLQIVEAALGKLDSQSL